MNCPTCRKEVEPGSRFAPFCSERCRLLDLGNWATETYRIPAQTQPDPDDENDDEHED